jgi:hypothetical protein
MSALHPLLKKDLRGYAMTLVLEEPNPVSAYI